MKKKSLLIIICSMFFMLYNIPASMARLNVLDYYRLCPSKLFPSGKPSIKYNRTDKRWTTDDGMEEVVVDTKNGYIHCLLAGGGETKIQFVLYLKKDKTPLVGISYYYNDGINVHVESSLLFYEYRNKKFIEVTKKVMPVIGISNFVKSNFNLASLARVKSFNIKNQIEYMYTLPQKGLTAHMEIDTGKLYNYISRNSSKIPAQEKKICDNLIKSIDNNIKIKLRWNMNKNVFILGKK